MGHQSVGWSPELLEPDRSIRHAAHCHQPREFGLIEEGGETKVFGAGILSSIGEIPNSLLSKDVERRPFVTEEVIETDYDPSRMQDLLFVLPSLPFLRQEVERLVTRFGVPV